MNPRLFSVCIRPSVLFDAHSPRPFHPAFGSSIRPSSPRVNMPTGDGVRRTVNFSFDGSKTTNESRLVPVRITMFSPMPSVLNRSTNSSDLSTRYGTSRAVELPMAAADSIDLRTRVLRDADAGLSSKDLAERCHVSRAWVEVLKPRGRARPAAYRPEFPRLNRAADYQPRLRPDPKCRRTKKAAAGAAYRRSVPVDTSRKPPMIPLKAS